MFNKTLTELADGLARGEYTSRELTDYFLERIKRLDPSLNSFITLSEDYAHVQADQADQRRKQGQAAPLTGIPIAQKDIFCTEGIKTTCASKMLDSFIAPYNAHVVERFAQEGAVLLGKTNMDEFAMGSSNENSHYGPVLNPWNLDTVPGGSSGGSAAAVAARLAPAATGTDTGGSIRQPAALCGITGIKPTYGRVSRYGMIAFASSLDQGGPLTQTCADAALVLSAMAGFDPRDSTCVDQPVPDYTKALDEKIAGLRIGLPKEYFGEGLDPNVACVIEAALKEYEKLGAKLVEISLKHSAMAGPAYYIIAPAECSSNLARYDGVRYGYRCDDPKNLEDLYKRSRAEGFGAEVKRRIMIGTYALSAGYYEAYYIKAQQIRRLLRDDFLNAFKEVDVIMGPTTPSVAFNLGEKSDDPLSMYLSDIYTIAVNLAGLPALSIPAGFVDEKPVGLQIIGNYFEEGRLLNVGHQYQQVTSWHRVLPAFAKGGL